MKTVLITGAHGFLGSYIYKRLKTVNEVLTLGSGCKNDIQIDLSRDTPLFDRGFNTVIHCAGKAHSVPKTELESKEFFSVNCLGLSNLLKGIDTSGHYPQSLILISTVAVYGVDSGLNIKESHPLNGTSPYAQSKKEAEKIAREWCDEHDVKLVILRLPLIAGENPPGNLGAMINGIKSGRYFTIGKGHAKKSIVLAEDVADLISNLSEESGTFNLTDRCNPTFRDIELSIAAGLKKNPPVRIPYWLARVIGKVGDKIGSGFPLNSSIVDKICSDLTFNDDLAHSSLGWKPRRALDHFLV